MMINPLPIHKIIPEIKTTLAKFNNVVLRASPGAGKTTIVPLELLGEHWLSGRKIIMLEPRRLAVRAAAKRMAEILGEKIGETVGYSIRMESHVGPGTRIEVVTEGIFIKRIQNNPEIKDVGLIIFDEFHERSLNSDLGLALALDVQAGLREDLKLLIMSATLDGVKIASLMDNAPIINSQGKSYTIDYHYLDRPVSGRIEQALIPVIIEALKKHDGGILVFLPGAGEIERVKKRLDHLNFGPEILIYSLYGLMTNEDQDFAIGKPPQGKRKIILSTSIAETSLTIEGIKVVIDSGLQRQLHYDVSSGMSKLTTLRVSRASADQRAGRAGRLEDGVCYRMWTSAAQKGLRAFSEPEINNADLVPLALDLALWGVSNPSQLKWLDLPDAATMQQAKELLQNLGAMDDKIRITAHGKKMASLPMHPRLSHMILKAEQLGLGITALTIAAILEERDVLKLATDLKTADLRLRLEALDYVNQGNLSAAKQIGCDLGAAKKILRQIKLWQKTYRINRGSYDRQKAGICLAVAFPDRIGSARLAGSGVYLLSGGSGAKLLDQDPLINEKYLSIGHLDKAQKDAHIFFAAPILKSDLEEHFQNLFQEIDDIQWDDRSASVMILNRVTIGAMPLKTVKIKKPNLEIVLKEMIVGIRKSGLSILPWNENSIGLRDRVILAQRFHPEKFENFSNEKLFESLETWLGPYLGGITTASALSKLDLYNILKNKLPWDQQQKLDEIVPTHITVPSGSKIAINYGVNPPMFSVKLQEMFGATDTPTILNGAVKLVVHLLSPAQRPLQITSDLKGFWQTPYTEIKKEMKGRYPKHPWPDDPLKAIATKKLKNRF
ncbi:MAG: ATP-dependent helicase HrpB [Proteobacteria bacterium]|jgi:ATP-dependent helicase HrpB|nr:ATP-dependent helicase HrpB [Pseudomonadota bacterium]